MTSSQCAKEVTDLHDFFLSWFTGLLREDDITRLEKVISKDFQLISPLANTLSRAELLKMIQESYKSRDVMKIWVEDIQTRKITSDIYLTTYYELQEVNNTTTKRFSSALFQSKPESPNGVEWLHVHETWVT